jgi:hypothetical protein
MKLNTKRIMVSAGGLMLSAGNALAAAESTTKTVGGMFLDIISPLEPMAQETLKWLYNWEVALIPACAFLALGFIYIKHVWGGGDGGREKSHSEKAAGEVKMESIVKGLAVLVVCMIVVYIVYDKLLKVQTL